MVELDGCYVSGMLRDESIGGGNGLYADLIAMDARQVILKERFGLLKAGGGDACLALQLLPVVLIPCQMNCLLVLSA